MMYIYVVVRGKNSIIEQIKRADYFVELIFFKKNI